MEHRVGWSFLAFPCNSCMLYQVRQLISLLPRADFSLPPVSETKPQTLT